MKKKWMTTPLIFIALSIFFFYVSFSLPGTSPFSIVSVLLSFACLLSAIIYTIATIRYPKG